MSDASPATTTETPAADTAVTPAIDGAPPSLLGDAGAPAPAEQPKPAEPPAEPAKPVVPEKYEFKAPEIDGKPLAIDAGVLADFETQAREAGFTQEQFQAAAKFGAQKIAELAAAPYRQWHETQREWQAKVKADPEFGGDKLPQTVAAAAKVMATYGDAELHQELMHTGGGNGPALIRLLARVGAAMGDPNGLLGGKPAPSKPTSIEQGARDFYNAGGGNYADVAV